MKEIIKKCDIENSKHCGTARTYEVDVVFSTEQNEGRTTSPYIDRVEIELCEACRNKMLTERIMPKAYGAMGFNHYKF